ncbi:hypothetical protein OPV22_015653 [Ensete ventricosum]|uniref:Protein kinase domain-containing protein n=1 Tax=Ensete ventricosum TaxID=4639 RepID=A0AAV8RE64_ENSVE|nr:hypothetical protein OPV22_015653 [Ensete ventricosum]
MRPPSFVLLLVVLLPISLRASVASPLSTVAISRASNTTVVCAVVRSRTNDEYELSCTSLPMGLERTYTSGNISSSAIAGGEGFLCFLRLSTNVSTMVWWGFYQESDYYGSSRDYKRVYRGPPLADLSAGDSRVCGIHAGGRPICWRWNQLVFPEGVKLSDIAVGGDFVCGLLRGSMEIRCFGNDTGVVGHEPTGSYRIIAAGSRHACAVSRDGKLVCWGAGAPAMGATPSEISSLALGENKTCALGSQGRVTCWGERSSLPCGHNDTQFLAIQAKGSAICGILMVDYSLFCWGSDVFDHNPVVYANVLPGTCVPISSCRCGVLEGSGTLCDRGSAVCRLCEPEKISNPTASPVPSSPPPPPPSTNRAGTSHKRRTAFVAIGSVGLAIGIAASFCFCLLHFGRCNGRVHDSGGMHSAAAGALPQGIASALARPHGSESAHTPIEWRFSSLVGRGCSPMLEEFPLSVLLAATDNFAESHKIGSGSFGSVYRATLDDGRVVAIKRAETSASTSKSPAGAAAAAAAENKRHDKESAFLAELALLSRVNHKNLVIRRYDDSSTPMNIVEFAVPHIVAHDIHRVLDPNLPPPLPSEIEAVTYVGYLAIDCVSPEGRERPTMTEVVNGLERAAAACDAPATSLDRSTTVRSI